ncbi:hypothetical protein B0T17DRAFT_494951 [Bombardia bombarda]|uniref:Erythromycin esterase n=1 Tax=Bombardia bombarda TaxID=252184 RepID=A0AA40C1F2_9PEZI|nr:hypothetical protein B0T17DRAFT_494951 [Bombardia bombarda]
MARRSARLASVTKSPKPAAEVPSLSSVVERDGSPEKSVAQSLNAAVSSPMPAPKTPGSSSPVKPPMSEMHPAKFHHSMAAPSSGLRLGFTDIKPTTNRDSKIPAALQTTPSKIGGVPTSPFTFRFARQTATDLKLGPEAQRMMDELREEALRIKADLKAKREAGEENEDEQTEEEQANTRKIAKAKGKAGRYSAVHMAEFKKMDSIANHPSAFRAQPGRTTTPLKTGIKRSQSKANLDEREATLTPLKSGIKRSQSKADLNERESVRAKQPVSAIAIAKSLSPVKRARQHRVDDASSNRPVSQDGSALPRPVSAGIGSGIPRSKPSFASLMTPTKSSLARTASVKTLMHGSLLRSPSKVSMNGGLVRSATTNNLPVAKEETGKDAEKEKEAEAPRAEITSPKSRFDRVKSMFRGKIANATKAKSALPLPSALTSQTPAPTRSQKVDTLAAPFTTPGRKLIKRVAFTPEAQRAALTQNSPSPVKSGIPRSKSQRQILGEVHYPTLDAIVMAEESIDRGISYPDLSEFADASERRPLPEPPIRKLNIAKKSAEASVPGTFTFRSDRTINFDSKSPEFGTSPGQSSVRPVRPSILPSEHMPGSFPDSSVIGVGAAGATADSGSPNKENEAPPVFLALPHGMRNKKRNRASTDEQEAEEEAAERAAKKRKHEMVPEGDALLAPRLMASAAKKHNLGLGGSSSSPKKQVSAPSRIGGGGTPSPTKKRGMISLSRLQMLSRPKARK